MNIDYNFDSFINSNPIILKFKDVSKIIKFQNKIVQQTNKTKKNVVDIFETVNIDQSLLTCTTKDNETTFDHLILFANTPINLIIKLLSSVLKVSLIDVSIKFKQNFKVPFNVYSNYLCIGRNPLELIINSNFKSEYMDYTTDFLKWYTLNYDYILNNIINNPDKNIFKCNHNFTTYEIVFYPKSSRICDLVELFNFHYTEYKFKRVIIHDSNLCMYHNDDKVQYIKNSKTYSVNTKHIIPKQNTLTLMYLCDISDEICLESIDIYRDTTFKLNFIVSHNITLDDFNSIVDTYLKKSLNELFEMLMIGYTSYGISTKLTIDDYYQMPGKFDSTYLIKNISSKNINQLKKLLTLDDIVSRFSSNTSLAIMSFTFINESLIYQFNNNYINKETINDNMTKINLLPEIHFTFGDNNLTIFCNKFYSIDELIFILSFTIPLLDFNPDNNKQQNESVEEQILDRVKNIPVKQNLKQLVATDPELFAPRVVGKNPRAYSALCQSKEQRPGIISSSEYEVLKLTHLNSIMKLQNQTYPDQTLYLLCPYESYPILNFHHFNNQKCIVRCTTKQANISQFMTCSKELNAEVLNITTSFNHQSQSIIKFNDNLPHRRQCYLPSELSFLSDFVCSNVNDTIENNEPWEDYLKRIYGCVPLIIKRDSETRTYEILTNYDFNNNFIYTLIIQPSNNPYIHYKLTNINTSQLLIVQNYPELKNFFLSVQKYDNKNTIWMTYINNLFGLNLDLEKSIYTFIDELVKLKYRPVIKFNSIVGFVYDNSIFYLVPQIYLLVNDAYKASYILGAIRDNIFKYPSISKFKLSENDKYCLDITTNKITGIFWNSENLMLCEPIESDPTFNTIIFDTSKYIEFILLENSAETIKPKNRMDEDSLIYKIILMMLKRFWYLNKSQDDLKVNFLKYINEFGIITNQETMIVKKTSKLINIYETKINKKSFDEGLKMIIFDYEIIDDLLFEVYESELKLPYDEDKEVIIKKYFIC